MILIPFDEVNAGKLKHENTKVQKRNLARKLKHENTKSPRFSPYFDNCIGAIDGTHVNVVVPSTKVVQHMNRKGKTSQNVLAICDFDMRFTFVVLGWPGSVHDMRVFNDAIQKYGDKFPHPPQGTDKLQLSLLFHICKPFHATYKNILMYRKVLSR